jgi:hypothetical protein
MGWIILWLQITGHVTPGKPFLTDPIQSKALDSVFKQIPQTNSFLVTTCRIPHFVCYTDFIAVGADNTNLRRPPFSIRYSLV